MLKTPPAPDTLEKIHLNARLLLELSQKKFGFAVDFSEEALVIADDLISIFFKLHRGHFYTAALMIGCYLGELVIQNLGGKWRKDLLIRKVGKTKALINPVMKAKKRLENGISDSLVFYYRDLKIKTTGQTDFAPDQAKIAHWRQMLRKGGWDRVLLERMLDKKEKRYVREEAADILGRIGDKAVIPDLLEALKNQETAYYAAIALQSLPDKKAFESLYTILKTSRSSALKIQVALALGELRDERAVDHLVKLLGHKDELLCYYSALALGRIGGKRVLDEILDIMTGSRKGKRVYAITALEILRDPRAVPALIEALFSADEEIKEAAARALQFIPDVRAVTPLLNLLKDPSSRLKILAAYALAHIGNNQFLKDIRKLMADPVPLVRSHAEKIVYWLENKIQPAKCI